MVDGKEVIFFVGADGSGKSYYSKWLQEYFSNKKYSTIVVWSRFNNYLTKPLLGVLRFTGHSYYREHAGVMFGYHDFERLLFLHPIYIFLQIIDVNLASYFKIYKIKKKYDVVICERGPLDTLVDVLVDVGRNNIYFKKIFFYILKKNITVFFIDRDADKIISTREELIYDYKLQRKIDTYRRMSLEFNWNVIDNNGRIDETKKQILSHISI